MRYIVMHKVDAQMESGAPPSRELIKTMGSLIAESLRNGTFVDGAGLHRSARRARLRCQGGQCQLERGPYPGGNELVESMALVRTESLDGAVEQARRYGAALGDAEIEVGPVVEPWDLTGAPKPAGVKGEQFLLLFKGEGQDDQAGGRSAAVARLDQELAGEGIFIKRHRIGPSGKGKRLPAPRRTSPATAAAWMDGPFTESKELIAGFSILEVPSLTEALAWADRYAAILTDSEVDVRPMAD